jgi:uncharacterized ubiquitin-like protein YukD
MEKHGIVSIDFSNLGGKVIEMKIPFHLSSSSLINDLVDSYNLEVNQDNLQLQSFKALLNDKIVTNEETLIDAGIEDGEILVIVK